MNENIKIKIVGDVMPSGVLYGKEDLFVSDAVVENLKDADLRIANLECAVSPYCDSPHFDPEKMSRLMDTVWCIDEDLDRIVKMGFEVVCLANNHLYDLDKDGLIYTIQQLDSLKILHCGAGLNLEEASKPAVITIGDKTIAILSFCDYREETVGYVPFATEDTPGLNPLYPMSYSCSEVKKYKELYDYVLVVPHWGVEHTWVATSAVIKDAKMLIDSGADAILGGHPHRIQTPFYYKKKPVFPSLGNFFFPDRYLNKPRPTWYPAKGTDTSTYPRLYGYPWVEEPTIKVWPEKGRVEMISTLCVGDKITMSYDYVYLNSDNYLGSLSKLTSVLSIIDVLQLKITLLMYKCKIFYIFVKVAHYMLNLIRRIYRRIKRVIINKK